MRWILQGIPSASNTSWIWNMETSNLPTGVLLYPKGKTLEVILFRPLH